MPRPSRVLRVHLILPTHLQDTVPGGTRRVQDVHQWMPVSRRNLPTERPVCQTGRVYVRVQQETVQTRRHHQTTL